MLDGCARDEAIENSQSPLCSKFRAESRACWLRLNYSPLTRSGFQPFDNVVSG
jgi:hypothetical protein